MHLRERERKPAPRTLDLHWLEPPRLNGTLTVRGPLEAEGKDDHAVSRGSLGARRVGGVGAPPRDGAGLARSGRAARRLTSAPRDRQLAAAGAGSCAWIPKVVSVSGPNEVISATSTASRPRPTMTRPTRGVLLRASNVCQRPSR